jgi:hypothetical protein
MFQALYQPLQIVKGNFFHILSVRRTLDFNMRLAPTLYYLVLRGTRRLSSILAENFRSKPNGKGELIGGRFSRKGIFLMYRRSYPLLLSLE